LGVKTVVKEANSFTFHSRKTKAFNRDTHEAWAVSALYYLRRSDLDD
jgi:hypothetical protein